MVQSSESTLQGVARFLQGGDVEFGKKMDNTIKVSGLRVDMGSSGRPNQDQVMHRLLLQSYGKGISDFDSPAEFIGAVHDAIRGRCYFEQVTCKLIPITNEVIKISGH